jgi:hypothetical protein
VYEFDVKSGAIDAVKTAGGSGEVDAALYGSERVWVEARME